MEKQDFLSKQARKELLTEQPKSLGEILKGVVQGIADAHKDVRQMEMEFKEQKDVQQIGVIEAIKEGVQAVAPGLSFRKIIAEVGAELKQRGAHGSHELAAAIFTPSSFVMYPRNQEQIEDKSVQPPELHREEQSRGGIEM